MIVGDETSMVLVAALSGLEDTEWLMIFQITVLLLCPRSG